MAWTKKQLAEARRMYKSPRNKKTWNECIAIAAKSKKSAPKKAAKKSAPKRTVKKTVTRRSVSKGVSGLAGEANKDLTETLRKIQKHENDLSQLRSVRLAGMSAKDKSDHRAKMKKKREYITVLKQQKTKIKRYI